MHMVAMANVVSAASCTKRHLKGSRPTGQQTTCGASCNSAGRGGVDSVQGRGGLSAGVGLTQCRSGVTQCRGGVDSVQVWG